jgi:predicted lipoprotein with Yx(FWY)xxD motif
MIKFMWIVATLTVAGAIAGCAGYAPVSYSNGVMTTNTGMTLYTFDKDTQGSRKSACNGQCAANWPPFPAGADSKGGGDWSVIMREDGTTQWAFDGYPLYLYAKDQKPGDRTGDGFNKVWHVIIHKSEPAGGDGY